ncbi:MAG: hypothetical protein Q8N23_16645 [Archangium sp.]|nr:hypothetical protein [Archangium sp.]MDP3569722.1 hypothetical protein [Archangium sp.]
MTPSDPAGLLQRMPELERIAAEDGPVRAALGSGDPFKLYRALRWGSWTGRLKAHQPLVKELLGNRRLFARPLNGTPSLFTMNSAGVGFVGEDERQQDGTYITGHFIVILFKLPLLPLGAYVVGPGDTTNTYRIFARVPMGGFSWAWSRAAALAAALLVVSGAWGAFQDSRFATVTVANGFRKSIQVEVGGQKATIAPNSTAALTVPVGSQPARALVEGEVVDEGPIEVASGNDAFIWNVGGVSPLFKYIVNYYAVEPAWQPEPNLTFLCGQRLVVESNIDFLFREADKSVSMSKGTKVISRTMLSAAWRQPGDGSQSACVVQLYMKGDATRLATVVKALRSGGEVEPEEETLPVIAALLTGADEGVWEQAKELHQRRGDDLDTERAVIWAAEETGHLDELLFDLEARKTTRPDDADLAFLLIRAAPEKQNLATWEAALEKHPEHDGLRRSVEYAAIREGQWERSLAVWRQRLQDEPTAACGDADLAALASVALHQEAEVLGALTDCPNPMGLDAVVAATRLAMAATQDTSPWLARLASDPQRQRARLMAGLPVKDLEHTPLERTARFLTAVHKSGDALFAELPNLPMEEVQGLDAELSVLIWAEAVRRKHSAATTFARRTHLTPSERRALEGFLTAGQPELETRRFSPLTRAVMYLTRSRAEGIAPTEKERLQKLVRQDAKLSGFVISALDHWPP